MTKREIEIDVIKTYLFVAAAFCTATGFGLFLGYLETYSN